MKALILSAGYATRLYPLTKDSPKPLLPIAGRPMVEYLIDKLEAIPCLNEIIIVTNDKFARNFEEWHANGTSFSKPIKILNDGTTSDSDKLGAVGDMEFSIEKEAIKDDLLVIAGDNLFKFNLTDFLKFAEAKSPYPSIGLYDVKNKEEVKKYSAVELDNEGRVIDFQEKPKEPRTSLIAICMYYFPEEKLNLISQYLKGNGNPDAPGYYIRWLHKQEKVYGYIFNGIWYDIGDIKSYQEANSVYIERRGNGNG